MFTMFTMHSNEEQIPDKNAQYFMKPGEKSGAICSIWETFLLCDHRGLSQALRL